MNTIISNNSFRWHFSILHIIEPILPQIRPKGNRKCRKPTNCLLNRRWYISEYPSKDAIDVFSPKMLDIGCANTAGLFFRLTVRRWFVYMLRSQHPPFCLHCHRYYTKTIDEPSPLTQPQIHPALYLRFQLLCKPWGTEEDVPGIPILPLPCDGFCLGVQISQNAHAHRFLPVFALAKDQVLSLRVDGGNVDFLLGIPVPPQLGEVKRPSAFCVQLPHSLFAHVLADIGNVVSHKAFEDFVHDNLAVFAFNEAPAGI